MTIQELYNLLGGTVNRAHLENIASRRGYAAEWAIFDQHHASLLVTSPKCMTFSFGGEFLISASAVVHSGPVSVEKRASLWNWVLETCELADLAVEPISPFTARVGEDDCLFTLNVLDPSTLPRAEVTMVCCGDHAEWDEFAAAGNA